MTCRRHVRAATRLARRRGVPYGSPRRSKVRSAQNPAALLELPDSSSTLPCSSSPNRTRSAGLRFGFVFCPQNWLICFAYSPRDSKQSRTDSTAASGIRLRRVFIISRYRFPRSPARFLTPSLFSRANRDLLALLYGRSCPRRDIFERPR